MDTNIQLTINSFRQLFPDISLTFSKIPDISLTAVKFPDISRFSSQVDTLFYTPPVFSAPQAVTPSEFRQDVDTHKTRTIGLACGKKQ